MERAELDAWVLSAREYNEDSVLATMLPAEWLETARRRTILVFLRDGDTVEPSPSPATRWVTPSQSAWDPEAEPDQWARLAALLEEADPQRIGINTSDHLRPRRWPERHRARRHCSQRCRTA
jgi:hypothetical protein